MFDYSCAPTSTGSITTADGSAVARIGSTAVMAAVHLEVTSPGIHSPESGDIGACNGRRMEGDCFDYAVSDRMCWARTEPS